MERSSLRSMAVLVGCAINNKGGRGQRNRKEIKAGTTFFIFLAASPLVRTRFERVFAATPLGRVPDKTAMLRRLRKRVMYGGLDLLDHSLLIYINGTQSKYHCRH